MSSRRLFATVTASIVVVIVIAILVSASVAGVGGDAVLLWVMAGVVGLTLIPMYLALHSNVGLGRSLAHQASHDSLTGLPNRAFLERRLERELAALDAEGQSVRLMILDLDGFKEVNDAFG